MARPNGERTVYFGGNDMINDVSTSGSLRSETVIHDGKDCRLANVFRHAGSAGDPLARLVRWKRRIRAGYDRDVHNARKSRQGYAIL